MCRRIWGYGILLLLVLAGLCIVIRKDINPVKSEAMLERILAKSMTDQESLIDYAVDDERVYAIISRSGSREFGDCLVIFRKSGALSYEREYSNDFSDLKPWKLELADVDGDGVMEILTAVRKTTHYDAMEKNRFFLFNYTDDKLVKKWTGSQIAGTWKDFYAKDFMPMKGEEVLFISQTEEGKERLGIYYWFQFGFLMLAQSEDYETIHEIRFTDESHLQMNCGQDQEDWINLIVKNGKIVQE